MRCTKKHPGAGTLAEDFRRDSVAAFAAEILQQGKSVKCVAGDHLGGETCIDCIVRLATNATKVSIDPVDRQTTIIAVNHLKEGVGVNSVAGSHAGGNTCAQVIAGVDDTY